MTVVRLKQADREFANACKIVRVVILSSGGVMHSTFALAARYPGRFTPPFESYITQSTLSPLGLSYECFGPLTRKTHRTGPLPTFER